MKITLPFIYLKKESILRLSTKFKKAKQGFPNDREHGRLRAFFNKLNLVNTRI